MRFSHLALLAAALVCAPRVTSAEPSTQAVTPSSSESPQAAAAVAPAPAVGAPASLQLQEPELKLKPGWGRAAGNVGLGFAVALTGLTVATAVFEYDYYHRHSGADVPLSVLGPALLGTLLLNVIGTPIVAIGSASSRYGAGVEGSPGLRMAAWMAYVLTLFAPFYALADSRVGLCAVAGVSLTSLALHSLEARIAGKQARQKLNTQEGLALDLFVAPTVLTDGRAAASFGLAGRF